jgi:hypothetical protein
MQDENQWGPARPWPLDRHPTAVPYDVLPGDIVRSDLIVRPHRIAVARAANRSDYLTDVVWVVNNAESFMLQPPRTIATHMVVGSYRVWQGGPFLALDESTELDAPMSDEAIAAFNASLEEEPV